MGRATARIPWNRPAAFASRPSIARTGNREPSPLKGGLSISVSTTCQTSASSLSTGLAACSNGRYPTPTPTERPSGLRLPDPLPDELAAEPNDSPPEVGGRTVQMWPPTLGHGPLEVFPGLRQPWNGRLHLLWSNSQTPGGVRPSLRPSSYPGARVLMMLSQNDQFGGARATFLAMLFRSLEHRSCARCESVHGDQVWR